MAKSNSSTGEQETGEQPMNAVGKPLFPSTLTMVACDQCDKPRVWPLNCRHDYAELYSAEYRHVDSAGELKRERDALREALASAAIPYEALLMDSESRKWIAPHVWTAIETAVIAARTALGETK